LVITDTITVNRNDAFNCYYLGGGIEECFFQQDSLLSLAIDVSGAEFPIMGNTEGINNNVGVVNSQDQSRPEQIDDAEKVNEYVSWYLNGTLYRAENPYLDVEPPSIKEKSEGIEKLINYSGVLNRLLPLVIQHRSRIATIEQARISRHDQVIGCTYGISILGFNIGGYPAPCYDDNLLSFIFGRVPQRLSYWDSHLPPIEDDATDWIDFLEEYKEWRGQYCQQVQIPPGIPLIGGQTFLLCGENFFNLNFWSNLFPYIPYSSTEDRKGLVRVTNPYVQPSSPDMTVTVNSLTTSPAELFFAHQQESSETADLLQSTYTPKEEEKTGPVSQVSPSEYCDLTQVRSNPGDNLFATEIRVDVDYTAEFSCEFDIGGIASPSTPLCRLIAGAAAGDVECVPDAWNCDVSYGRADCGSGRECGIDCSPPNPSCTVKPQVRMNTITESPLVDDVWSRLVAGPMGVFKRIFPRVESGAPIEGILDIPGATGVSFSLLGAPAGVTLSAGNPSNQRSALELYFPHVGGIHEYFLKCIQQALRPQGFGEGCLSGAPGTQAPQVNCDPNVPDSAIPATYRGGYKANFLTQANQWTATCPGPQNNLAEECYNDTVKQSVAAGVNPAFSLTIWLNESDASNYCHGGPTTQDFGINDPSIAQNWGEQLRRFLALPYSGTYASCLSQGGWTENMHAFLNTFKAGGSACSPSNPAGNQYYNNIKTFTWPLVNQPAGGCLSGGLFAISWPTDNSCP
jgi:hypothetical protein